jgi:hypothetical protein
MWVALVENAASELDEPNKVSLSFGNLQQLSAS